MKPLAAFALVLAFAAPAGAGGDPGILERASVDAAGRGDLRAVEDLLAAGADPNATMDGYPVLQEAVQAGNAGIVEALLAAGADVNGFGEWVPGCCQELDTALHQAVRWWPVCLDRGPGDCSERRTEVVRVLLAAGADVDARDGILGATPLKMAARRGIAEVMEILVRAGAGPNAR